MKIIMRKLLEKLEQNSLSFFKSFIPRKPDWLTWDIILLFITSLLILFGHLFEMINLKFFSQIRIWFFIIISIIAIVTVVLQGYRAYKNDRIIEDFEMKIILQINALWDKNDFTTEGNSIIRLDDRATLKLEKCNSSDQDSITLYSDFLSTRFANQLPDEDGRINEQIGIVALNAKTNPFFSLSGQTIDIFKDICVFKIDLKSKVFSNLKSNTIVFIQSEVQMYMNGIKRSSFIVEDRQKLSLKDDKVIINFNIENKYKDLFYLLSKRIKSKKSFLIPIRFENCGDS